MVTTAKRDRPVLKIEELSMNTHVIAQELRERHDPKEARIWAVSIDDLEQLRSYVTGDIGDQLIEHALLLARLGQRMDREENRADGYIVKLNQWITGWTQTAEGPTRG